MENRIKSVLFYSICKYIKLADFKLMFLGCVVILRSRWQGTKDRLLIGSLPSLLLHIFEDVSFVLTLIVNHQ